MHDFQKGMSDVHVAMHARVWGSGGRLPCLNFCFVVVVVVIVFFFGKIDILGLDLLAVDIFRSTQQEQVRVA